MEHIEPVKIFEHCRLILGMVLSLSVARLLNGLARFVQHPNRTKIFLPHILWAFAILLHLIHFWWWEFKLIYVREWVFETYLLLILYTIDIFLLCCLLFPDDIQEYSGFEEYFMSRRKWFFSIFAVSFIIDFFDTAVKGSQYFASLGWEYPVRNVVYLIACVCAIWIKSTRVQLGLVVIALVYEISYILRLYHTMH